MTSSRASCGARKARRCRSARCWLNSAILYYLLIRFAKKPISYALKSRKTNIFARHGRSRAHERARLKPSSPAMSKKLATLDQEIERVRSDMRSAGESERKRILAEAKEKRTRMERDAQTLIGQELKAAREGLTGEMVKSALKSAESTLRAKITAADQNRLAEEYLAASRTPPRRCEAKYERRW